MEGSSISKEVPSTLQPVNSTTSLSKSDSNPPTCAPPEDEEKVDTPDQNNDSAPIAPSTETVPKLRKHPAKFECAFPNCKKRFTRRVNLETHWRTSHSDTSFYDCMECDKNFARIEDLRRHAKERHRRKTQHHVCGVLGTSRPEGCGQTFTRAEALRRHLRSKAGSKCGKPRHEEESEEE
jgi:uncharacterized Zn-finger protein